MILIILEIYFKAKLNVLNAIDQNDEQNNLFLPSGRMNYRSIRKFANDNINYNAHPDPNPNSGINILMYRLNLSQNFIIRRNLSNNLIQKQIFGICKYLRDQWI